MLSRAEVQGLHVITRAKSRGVAMWREAALRQWRMGAYTSEASPVVVGGCPRSGTTLLRVLLDTHPALCCGPESNLFLPRLPDPEYLAPRYGTDEVTIRRLTSQSGSQAAFIDEFFASYGRLRGRARWAEKTPANVRHLDFIFDHFPRARFVHMIRDGRDTVCSMRTHPRNVVVDGRYVPVQTWNPLDECISKWVCDVQDGMRWRGDPRYLEVRYEELVQAPRATLEAVCAFIGEEFDERVLRHDQEQDDEAGGFPLDPDVSRPINTGAVSKWQAQLTPDEVGMFKAMAGPLLMILGYVADDRW